MSDYDHDYDPPDTYEVIWTSGHVERVQGHHVIWPPMFDHGPRRREHVMVHGQINGRWKLVLSALPQDIVTIRLVTADEPVPRAEP